MEAITIFKRCRAAAGDIRRLQQRIQQRRAALTSITSPQADPNGGSKGSTDPDKYGKLLADIDALERDLEARKQARTCEIAAACVLLDKLPETESGVLHGYYIAQETTAIIAVRLKYQDSYIRKVKRNAEKMLGDIPPEQVAAALPPWYLKEYGGKETQ